MKLLAYLRVSTDDKGQNPQRQFDVIKTWASTNGVELTGQVPEEGVSGDTDPLERAGFRAAIEEARFKGATGIVVESPDRFSRGGIDAVGVAKWRLQKEERLDLFFADMTLAEQDGLYGSILRAIKAAMAKEWLDNHRKKVKSGMDRARANGSKFGRKPKQFTDPEIDVIRRELAKPVYRNKKGNSPTPGRKGWKGIAHEINTMRGCFEIADPKFREKKMISESTVKRLARQLGLLEGVQGQKSEGVKMEN